MLNRVVVRLDDMEYALLFKVAESELRNPSDQLRQILRETLIQRGLASAADFIVDTRENQIGVKKTKKIKDEL